MAVTEDLTIDASRLENGRGSRLIFFPTGTDFEFVGVTNPEGGVVPATPSRTGEEVRIAWTFRPAGEQRFLIRYVVTGAVRAHRDSAEMYWTWLDTRNPLQIDGMTIDVTWPEEGGEPLM